MELLIDIRDRVVYSSVRLVYSKNEMFQWQKGEGIMFCLLYCCKGFYGVLDSLTIGEKSHTALDY